MPTANSTDDRPGPGPSGTPGVRIRRAYEPRQPDDGRRVLVDRLWPRGLSKHDLEPPAADEGAIVVEVDQPVEAQVKSIIRSLQA